MSSRENKWLDVKQDIERLIISGELQPGKAIPSIREMQNTYHIGQKTAQRVIASLDKEGVIVRRVGSGCFVKPFVREELIAAHKRELQGIFLNVVETGVKFGLSVDEMKQMIDDAFISIVS